MDILKDTNFEKNFSVINTSTDNPVQTGILNFNNDPDEAHFFWKLAQWGSAFSIADATLNKNGKLCYYENKGKRISREIGNDGRNTLSLAVYASNEYKAPRKYGELWPHLLIEQEIKDSDFIKEFEKIQLNLDVRISRLENKMSDDYNESLHCAQTSAYFTVADMNPSSKGYADYLWFGIPLFDCRFDYPPGGAVRDCGAPGTTNKLIFTPPGREILSQKLTNGNWEAVNVDILHYIKNGFNEGKALGYLPESTFSDLKLTSFNLGWEVTGTFDVEMQIRNLSCLGK